MRGLIAVGLLVFLPVLEPARAAELTSAELLSQPFSETYQPEVEVSGNVIVGVMSSAAHTALVTDRLGVLVAETAVGADVCVRATSSDGIYSSRNHYRLPTTAGQQAYLPYASDMDEVLNAFAAGELAVTISTGDCESTAVGSYLVAGSLDGEPGAPVLIYLNGFGATDVFTSLADDGPLEACEYITEGRRTTYDFACAVIVPPGGVQTLTIVRERFGREQPAVTIELVGVAG